MDILAQVYDATIGKIVALTLALSESNMVLIAFGTAIIICLIVLLFIARTEQSLRRGAMIAAKSLPVDEFIHRLVGQIDLLRAPDKSPLSAFRENIFLDGRSDSTVKIHSDMFLLAQIAISVTLMILVGVIVIVLRLPAFALALAVGGYFLPLAWAMMHNRARRKALLSDLPSALVRIQIRISSDGSFQDALYKVSNLLTGPIATELAWAAQRMYDPVDDLDVLREIDERNGIVFFGPMADQLQIARRGSQVRFQEMFAAVAERQMEAEYAEMSDKVAGLRSKVTIVMTPFLLFALMLTIAAPYIIMAMESSKTVTP